MHLDRRTGLLWVATLGGAIAEAYEATSGDLVQSYALGARAVPNDLVITRDAVYVTDFKKPYLYRIDLGPDGTPLGTFDAINIPALGGGAFLGNGIVEAQGGGYLIVGLSGPGQLVRISTSDFSDAQVINLSAPGAVPGNDGLVLQGHTLYVCENGAIFLAAGQAVSRRLSCQRTSSPG